MTLTAARASSARPRRVDGLTVAAWAAVAVALLAVGIAYGRARWPGALPIGSDNDEYLLVGRALSRFEAPVVAGVEGTKYPLGYPLVLAVFEWLRLPTATAALVLNVAALAATVGLLAWLVGRPQPGTDGGWSPGAGLAAGGVVVTSVAVWNDVYSVMPELLLLLVVTALLVVLSRPFDRRTALLVTAVAIVAVGLKTLAILLVLGGAGLAWLAVLRRRRVAADAAPPPTDAADAAPGRVLWPAAGAVGVVGLGLLAMRPYAEHTTGYLATFPLVDPDDASLGRVSPLGLVRRTIADVPDTWTDIGRAIALIDAGTGLAVVVAIVGLTLGVWGAFRLRPGTLLGPFAAGMAVAYAAGMAAWPYHSSRFGIPLVPVAALGVGAAVRMLPPRRMLQFGAGLLLVAGLVWTSWGPVVDRGERGRAELERHHAALDELDAWAAGNLDDLATLVSFDYREVARLLDRDVAPIGYTSDPAALLAQVGDADTLVVLDLYPKRTRQARILLDHHPESFTPALEGEDVAVYRVDF